MYFDLKTMLRNLLEIIVEAEVIQNVKSANSSSRLIKVDKIDLEFGMDTTLKKLRTADFVSKAMSL